MSDFYQKAYMSQAGSGLDIYSGYGNIGGQTGRGYLGKFYTNSMLPLMRHMRPEPVLSKDEITQPVKVVRRRKRNHSVPKKKSATNKKVNKKPQTKKKKKNKVKIF